MTDQFESFGQELRRRRLSTGMSLRGMAKQLHYSPGYLSKIENEHKVPPADLARRCDAMLGANGELAALITAPVAPVSGQPDAVAFDDPDNMWTISVAPDGSGGFQPVGRRELVLGVGAAALVGFGFSGHGMATVARDGSALAGFAAHFDNLRRQAQTASPSVVLPTLFAQIGTIRAIAASGEGELRLAWFLLAARFAEFTGWMAQEVGEETAARQLTGHAVRLAAAGGDPHFARYGDVRLADMAMYRYDAASTIELARKAQADPSAPVRVRAFGAVRQAQGHGIAGQYDECQRQLDRAGRLFELAAAEEAPGPVLGSTNLDDPVASARAWSLYELGRPVEAAAALDLVVKRIPPAARRARALWGARRVLSYAAAGEVEYACRLTDDVLDDARAVDSATGRNDLRQLGRTLARWRTHPPVRDLLPRLTRALHRPAG